MDTKTHHRFSEHRGQKKVQSFQKSERLKISPLDLYTKKISMPKMCLHVSAFPALLTMLTYKIKLDG